MSLLQSLLAALRSRARSVDRDRRSRRFALSTPAAMRVADTVGAKWEAVTLDDLSIGGARVVSALSLARKSQVDLKLPLGQAGEIPVRAVVVRAAGAANAPRREYGLRFIDLSYDRYRVLIRFIGEREGTQAADDRSADSRRA